MLWRYYSQKLRSNFGGAILESVEAFHIVSNEGWISGILKGDIPVTSLAVD